MLKLATSTARETIAIHILLQIRFASERLQ